MAELIDVIELPDGNTKRIYDNGREQIVNAEGKIVTTKLPPEVAKSMAKRSAQKRADITDDVGELLNELGLESVSARLLAEQFVSGGAGAVGAARELFKMARPVGDYATFESASHYFAIPPGGRCPRCGTWNINGMYSGEELKELLDATRKLQTQMDGSSSDRARASKD